MPTQVPKTDFGHDASSRTVPESVSEPEFQEVQDSVHRVSGPGVVWIEGMVVGLLPMGLIVQSEQSMNGAAAARIRLNVSEDEFLLLEGHLLEAPKPLAGQRWEIALGLADLPRWVTSLLYRVVDRCATRHGDMASCAVRSLDEADVGTVRASAGTSVAGF